MNVLLFLIENFSKDDTVENKVIDIKNGTLESLRHFYTVKLSSN